MEQKDYNLIEDLIKDKIKWALQIEEYDGHKCYYRTSYKELLKAILDYLDVDFEVVEIPRERKTMLKKKNK